MLKNGISLPTVTADEMREVDRLMIHKYGIELIQMMENAGRNLADLATGFLGSSAGGKRVIVASGKGNNGGGGLAAARHLSNWGAKVTVLVPGAAAFSGVSKHQWEILARLPVETIVGADAEALLNSADSDLVIDALVGYSLSGNPRGWLRNIIKAINGLDVPVMALDVPSGLDATTGKVFEPCIEASATMTLALPKTGLLEKEARRVTGTLYLADIGVPAALYEQMGLVVGPVFSERRIVKLLD